MIRTGNRNPTTNRTVQREVKEKSSTNSTIFPGYRHPTTDGGGSAVRNNAALLALSSSLLYILFRDVRI